MGTSDELRNGLGDKNGGAPPFFENMWSSVRAGGNGLIGHGSGVFATRIIPIAPTFPCRVPPETKKNPGFRPRHEFH